MEKQLKILIIDDSELDIFLHSEFIKKSTLKVDKLITYNNAIDALNYLSNCSNNDWPDLILVDIRMPIIDGFEFLSRYKLLANPNIQKCNIVMVSSSSDFTDVSKANANTMIAGFINKPMVIENLIKIIEEQKITAS